MKPKVLDVGNCAPDHASIRNMLHRSFEAKVVQAHGLQDTLEELRSGDYDLVLINRKLDLDYSDGVEILRAIKRETDIASVPVMLITNYPEHQEAAIQAGAERGFGKLELDADETRERLAAFLA